MASTTVTTATGSISRTPGRRYWQACIGGATGTWAVTPTQAPSHSGEPSLSSSRTRTPTWSRSRISLSGCTAQFQAPIQPRLRARVASTAFKLYFSIVLLYLVEYASLRSLLRRHQNVTTSKCDLSDQQKVGEAPKLDVCHERT